MMHTNFAQILVSKLKMISTNVKVGFLSLIFTFVFLGMGNTSHAQSLATSDTKIDASVLDSYSFKQGRAYVTSKLDEVRQNQSNTNEAYVAFKNHFITAIKTNLTSSNVEVRQAVINAYYSVSHYAKNYQAGVVNTHLNQAIQEVSSAIN
jgi:hypothetical protein